MTHRLMGSQIGKTKDDDNMGVSEKGRNNNHLSERADGGERAKKAEGANRDIVETLQSRTDIEDELSSQVRQLSTLCAVQLAVAMDGQGFKQGDLLNYSLVLKQYAKQINTLVDQLYND